MRGRDARSSRQRSWLLALSLLAITCIAYQPVWHAGFIWDDDRFLTANPLIQQADGLYRFWFSTAAPDYFPMTSTTLWLEWRLWGNHPLGYHLMNVLLHALSAGLWWRVLARLKIPGAWLAAALFALHPVNVAAVAWITERKDTLAMVFCAGTLLGYLRFEDTGRRRYYWLALGAFLVALLSKTAVAPLPLVLLVLAWWRRKRVARQDVWRCIPFFALSIALSLVTVWFQYQRNIGADIVRIDGLGSRLAVAGWAVWFYLYKALFPLGLSFVYPRWQVRATELWSYVPGLLFAAGLVICWRYRERWGRPLLFGVGAFALMLLPVLGFLNIYFMRYSFVADQWAYFSILGPVTLVAAGLARLGRGGGTTGRFLGPGLSGALLLALGTLTWQRAAVFRDPETLWRDTLKRNPHSWLANNNLGFELEGKGQFDEAIEHYAVAVQADPDSAETYRNLGNALAQARRLEEAAENYRHAVQLKPDFFDAVNSLGVVLAMKGDYREAIDCFQEALRLKPDFARAHANLANALRNQKDLDGAIRHYEEAVRSAPRNATLHNSLGSVLEQKGLLDQAVQHYAESLRLNPTNPACRLNLGRALAGLGRPEEARAQLNEALRLNPDLLEAKQLLDALRRPMPE